jgi:hypothetical protein
MLPKHLRTRVAKVGDSVGVADIRRQLVIVLLRRVQRVRLRAAAVEHDERARRRMARELVDLRREIFRQWELLPETRGGQGAPWRWHV